MTLLRSGKNNIWANDRSALERKIRARDSSGFQTPLSPVWVKHLIFTDQLLYCISRKFWVSHFCWCISFCLFWSSFSLLSLFTATAAAACWLFDCCSLRKFWRSVPSLGTGWFRTPVPVFDSSSSSSSSPPENWYSTYHYYYQKKLTKKR